MENREGCHHSKQNKRVRYETLEIMDDEFVFNSLIFIAGLLHP